MSCSAPCASSSRPGVSAVNQSILAKQSHCGSATSYSVNNHVNILPALIAVLEFMQPLNCHIERTKLSVPIFLSSTSVSSAVFPFLC